MIRHATIGNSTVVSSTIAMLCLIAGCASYTVPGRGANMQAVGVTPDMQAANTDGAIQQSLSKKPLANFPTGIAVARVQAPHYRSYTAQAWGYGRYSLIITRDVEKEEHFDRMTKLPQVLGVAPVNRLLFLSDQLNSDMELRQAAAALHADVLLIYTLDTIFYTDDLATPLTVVSLGLSPNKKVRLLSTASAVLMDTRNGYVYAVAEASSKQERLTSAWSNKHDVDASRLQAEADAFDKLVTEFEKTWPHVLRQYAPAPPTVTR